MDTTTASIVYMGFSVLKLAFPCLKRNGMVVSKYSFKTLSIIRINEFCFILHSFKNGEIKTF